MLIAIPDVVTGEALDEVQRLLLSGPWEDGNVTSGAAAALAKRNMQLPETCDQARAAQAIVMRALSGNATFLSAALPKTIFPPLFSSYLPGDKFGFHVDNAIRAHAASGARIRTDLSATLFLNDPADYDGGELVIETRFGTQSAKLPAGHMILYPSTSIHRVTEITRGRRLVSFMWLQSLVADSHEREMLFELDQAIQALAERHGLDDPEVVRLTAVYHNLVRKWAEV